MNKNKKTTPEKEIQKEIDKYQKPTFLSRVPFCIKAILIKYWFFGAICFFVFMGLGLSVASNFNLVLVAGLIGGSISDIATYNILDLIDNTDEKYKYYVFYKTKKLSSFVINILYNIVLFFAFAYTVTAIKEATDSVESWLFREPLTQALILTVYDALLIQLKNIVMKLFKKVKK